MFPIPTGTHTLSPLSTWHSTFVRWSLWACVLSPAFCPVNDQSQPYPSSALPSSLSSVDKPEASAPDTRHLWLVGDRVVCPGCPLQHHLHPFTSVVPERDGEHSSGCVWLCLCLRGPRSRFLYLGRLFFAATCWCTLVLQPQSQRLVFQSIFPRPKVLVGIRRDDEP